MKKIIMGVLLILMLMVAPLTAETATSAITLSGSVAKHFSVTPSTLTYAFVNTGASDAALADLTIVSNFKAGFSITFTSTKGSFNITTTEGSLWGYSLKLTDTTTSTTSSVGYNTPITFTSRKHPGAGQIYPLLISYASNASLDEGTYAGDITITITSL